MYFTNYNCVLFYFQSEPTPQQAPANGGNSNHRDLPIKSEDPIPKSEPETGSKKPRLSDPPLPPPPGSVPAAMFPGDPAYGLYLYQSWAQAAAKLGPGGAGPMHPAAAAAWQAHLAQAVKVSCLIRVRLFNILLHFVPFFYFESLVIVIF